MALSTGILQQAPSDELQRRRLRLQEDLARQSEIERQGKKRAKQLEVDNDLKVPAYREYLNRDISKYKKDVLSGNFSDAYLNREKTEILNRQAAMKSVDNIVDKAYEAYSLGKVKGVKDDVNSLNMLWLDPNSAIEGLDFPSVLKGGASVAARISQPEADPMGFITNEGAKIAKAFLSSADPEYKKIATQDNRTFGEITRDLKQSNPEMLEALHKAMLSNRGFREGLAIEKDSYEGIDDYYYEMYADMVPTRSNRQADASIPSPKDDDDTGWRKGAYSNKRYRLSQIDLAEEAQGGKAKKYIKGYDATRIVGGDPDLAQFFDKDGKSLEGRPNSVIKEGNKEFINLLSEDITGRERIVKVPLTDMNKTRLFNYLDIDESIHQQFMGGKSSTKNDDVSSGAPKVGDKRKTELRKAMSGQAPPLPPSQRK